MAYIFDPDSLQKLVREAADLGQPIRGKIAFLRERLEASHPGHIRHEDEWIFNFAGGAKGNMTILHASLTEYVIVFGTPFGTTGFSGRYTTNDYFMILEGEHWVYEEDAVEHKVLKPGEVQHTRPGTAHIYKMPRHCYALEYARGFIPSMLPFGLADSLTSTLDLRAFRRTAQLYTRSLVGELLRGKI